MRAGDEAAMCWGKVRHKTQGDAMKAINRMHSVTGSRRTKREVGAQSAYHCPHCNGWHMGGRDKNK